MKIKFFYISIFLLLNTFSCTKSDEFSGELEVFDEPSVEGASPESLKIKSMYETYKVVFKPTFTLEEYTWDWNAKVAQTAGNVVGMRFSPAKMSYVNAVIDSVDNWIFKSFSSEFSKQNMPLNILLVDTLGNKLASGTTMIYRMYEGNITNNYIVLSYVSERFEAEKNKRFLRESWMSLFMEKMLQKWPSPVDFAQISATAYAKASLTNAEDVVALYALLKKGRQKQTTATATSAWRPTSLAQDFGDYVAFIIFTPESEKQLEYTKNANVLVKVTLVKKYFKDNFGIDLPYKPIAN